jgi:hypothetical protein
VALNLTRGRLARTVDLVTERPDDAQAEVDLVVVDRPGARALAHARSRLRPGGELVARFGVSQFGRGTAIPGLLEKAGFENTRLYWPGPDPAAPAFWLELGSPAARAYVLETRPARGLPGHLLRLLWRAAARLGLLTPIYALAQAPAEDVLASPGRPDGSQLLLTGGHRVINKAVAIDFRSFGPEMSRVVKFARVAAAEPGLTREATALQALASGQAHNGAPRVLGVGRRAGRLAVAESPLPGSPLLDQLSPSSLDRLAGSVTDWLLTLAERPARPVPRDVWWERLAGSTLRSFAAQFGPALEPEVCQAVADRLSTLPDLPLVFEHRDCSPWNVVIGPGGAPALMDWESSEPQGLPCLDLIYFLANAAFILDGALESRTTRTTYRSLLSPDSVYGKVAERCFERYCAELGIDPAALPALRLLTWLIHSRSDFRHLELEGQTTPARLRAAPFLGLVLQEVECSAG